MSFRPRSTSPLARRALGAALGTLACLAPGAATAQTATLPAAEAEALRLKQRGEYRQATEKFLALLSAPQGNTDRDAALAEYYATLAFQIGRSLGDLTLLGRAFDEARQDELARSHPFLADRLDRLGLQVALAAGDLEESLRRTQRLGFITEWWLLGPLDNERGGGFAQTLPPEQRLDLDATLDGKERPVRWHPLQPGAVPGGRIDLDAMVRPNDQVLCYAATCLWAEQDQTALLSLGSDEAFAVFVNGEKVVARDVRRSFFYDQDRVAVRLRAGPNLLLLKICEQEEDFEFAARLTALTGAALDGVAVRVDEAAMRAAADAPAAAAADAPEPTDLGARTLFAQSVEASGDPLDAFRLAYLLTLHQPDDPSTRRDHQLATTAVTGMPDSTAAHYLLALTRVRRNARAEEKDENARRHDYEAIIARDPEHGQARLALAQMDLEGLGAAESAEALLREALAIHPGFTAARLALARALYEQDLDELASREVAHAATGPGGSRTAAEPMAMRRLGALQVERGDLAAAIDSWQTTLARAFDPQLASRLAELQLQTGRREDAVDLLRRTIALAPMAREPRLRWANLLEAEGKPDEALAVMRDWLDLCPEDDDAMVRMARLHRLGGHVEAQREWLRLALDINPNRKVQRRHLEYFESDEKPFYDGFEVSGDEILTADAGPPEDATEQNDPYYYLLDQRVIRAYRNGTTSEYHHTIQRALTEEGARRLGSYGVPHYRGEQRARLLSARVIKKNGQVLQPQMRGWWVSLPPVEIGDAVELRSRIDDIAPSFFGDYFGLEHGFIPGDGAPCRQSLLTVCLEEGRDYRLQVINGAPMAAETTSPDGAVIHRFAMSDLPRRRIEAWTPDWAETEPLVRISTYRDWNHFSSWWWNLVRKQSEISPAIRAKVEGLTAGLTTDEDRIAAIYDFVTTEIRYTAWEFGVHGYKPYTTPVIFERRHGDCKDKSLLLNAMLSVVDIEAYPVLIWANTPRSTDDLSLALLQHFNHCISYLPPTEDRPAMFLDGTATYHPSDTVPDMDQGAEVLVVVQNSGEIERIPWATADSNRTTKEFAIALTGAGDAQVQLTEQPRRNLAVPLRAQLGNEPAKRQEKLERRLASAFGKVQVERVECSDLLDMQTPAELTVDFTAPQFASRQDNGLVLPAALEARDLLPLVRAEQRELPLLLGTPDAETTTLRYRLPAGYAPVELPPPTRLETRFGSYELNWTFTEGELRIERHRSTTLHRIEPAEYPEFREFAIAVGQADRQVVVVEPQEGQ